MGIGRLSNGLHAFSASLDWLVISLCADYRRREQAIRERTVSRRTAMEYKYINHNIFAAAAEIVTERYARVYIEEIGSRLGFAQSSHDAVSEARYKIEKREVKLNIARRLHLID